MTFEIVLGEIGDKGANGVPTAVPGLHHINYVGAAGQAAPAGAVTGDAVIDTLGNLFRTSNGGVLEAYPNTSPLQPAEGQKGPDGGWAPHQHTLTYDAPTTYDEYFERCVWPGFPEPASIVGGEVTNVPGVAALVRVEPGAAVSFGRTLTGAAYDFAERVTAQRAVRAALPSPEKENEPLLDATYIRKACVKIYGTTTPVDPSNAPGLGEEGPWLAHPNQVGAACIDFDKPAANIENIYEVHIPPVSTAQADYTGFIAAYPTYQDVILYPNLPRAIPFRMSVLGPRARDPVTPEAWLPAHFYAAVFVWDNYGNGPIGFVQREAGAGAWNTRPLWELTQVLKDITPPKPPRITGIQWNEGSSNWTVTVQAPADTDVQLLRIGFAPGTQTAPTSAGSAQFVVTPNQIVTWTSPPVAVDRNPPAGQVWSTALNRHAVQAAFSAEAEDLEQNVSDLTGAASYQPGGPAHYPPPPIPPRPPPINNAQAGFDYARSRAYDHSGTRADNQWGSGILHTGNFGPNHGNQWGAAYVDLRGYAGYRVTSMTLSYLSTHTYYGGGASYSIGHHWHAGGLPPTLTSGFQAGSVAYVHAPKYGWVTVGVPLHIAQAFVDGQAFGFVFGGPGDNSKQAYSSIQFSSITVTFNLA